MEKNFSYPGIVGKSLREGGIWRMYGSVPAIILSTQGTIAAMSIAKILENKGIVSNEIVTSIISGAVESVLVVILGDIKARRIANGLSEAKFSLPQKGVIAGWTGVRDGLFVASVLCSEPFAKEIIDRFGVDRGSWSAFGISNLMRMAILVPTVVPDKIAARFCLADPSKGFSIVGRQLFHELKNNPRLFFSGAFVRVLYATKSINFFGFGVETWKGVYGLFGR